MSDLDRDHNKECTDVKLKKKSEVARKLLPKHNSKKTVKLSKL